MLSLTRAAATGRSDADLLEGGFSMALMADTAWEEAITVAETILEEVTEEDTAEEGMAVAVMEGALIMGAMEDMAAAMADMVAWEAEDTEETAMAAETTEAVDTEMVEE